MAHPFKAPHRQNYLFLPCGGTYTYGPIHPTSENCGKAKFVNKGKKQGRGLEAPALLKQPYP
jgi:hypothetical protein